MSAAVDQARTTRPLAPAVLVGALVVAAWLAVAAGLSYAAMAAMGKGTSPEAPVRLTAPVGYTELTLPCVEGWSMDGSSCAPAALPDEWPGGEPLPVRRGGDLLAAPPLDPEGAGDPLTSLLATASLWAGLAAAGLVGLLLVPALRSTASGRPFAAGNARRLLAAAAVVGGAWLLATIGDYVAAGRIVAALEAAPRYSPTGAFDMPVGWLAPALHITWWPALVASMLLALAAATRRGARLASDTEGLV
ncbi:hypothetical protein ICW40_00550 [Actinotalea ferrariae]|uniref:hypothetical protein n=1 Tax=Actinotalea ferrariae TaxID=1386098 RepID=UPI001C8C96F0|nr:hypothetical protein [Actinotalea ferrariae]MBX9243298.1 hypothetical protein [Actinotalea ferrariae]